jgi:hypothetical protein
MSRSNDMVDTATATEQAYTPTPTTSDDATNTTACTSSTATTTTTTTSTTTTTTTTWSIDSRVAPISAIQLEGAQDFTDALPCECVTRIFSYLDETQLSTLLLVSRQCNRLASHDQLVRTKHELGRFGCIGRVELAS